MKKFIVALMLVGFSGVAVANGNDNNNHQHDGNASSSANATGGAGGAGGNAAAFGGAGGKATGGNATIAAGALATSQTQSATTGNLVSTNTYEAAASTAYSPSLTSGIDTCMGSSSVGGTGMSFGFSVGTTWTDSNCVRLKNAREMAALGHKNVAVAMMCQDEKVREAAKSIGSSVCGAPSAAPKAAKTSGGPDMTDPFINARLQGK